MEQIRLLSNIETFKSKLIQIVLLGQPELMERLSKDGRLRALRQRIAVHHRIQPLQTEEVKAYIRHRIQVAGPPSPPIHFTEEAMALIAELSQGVPRRINLLCDRILLAGFVHETHQIGVDLVRQACSDGLGDIANATGPLTGSLLER
jgi:general secretion pathway protein A